MLLPVQSLNADEVAAQVDSLKVSAAERIRMFAGMTWEERYHLLLNDLLHVGVKLLVVVAVFIVGRWLIRKFVGMLNGIFERRQVDPSIRTFIRSLVNIVLYIVMFYFLIDYLGVNTALFVGIFSAVGLAIGMAMSGVFQNFASGILILVLKPFKVGDSIEAQGQAGKVLDIRLFNTVLRTADNQTILLPNGIISTGIVKNVNAAKTRRLEWVVSFSSGTDFEAVERLLTTLLRADGRILTTPAPEVVIGRLNPGTIDVVAHAWVASGDYSDVLNTMNAVIYKTLPERGFPFPSSTLNVSLTK